MGGKKDLKTIKRGATRSKIKEKIGIKRSNDIQILAKKLAKFMSHYLWN